MFCWNHMCFCCCKASLFGGNLAFSFCYFQHFKHMLKKLVSFSYFFFPCLFSCIMWVQVDGQLLASENGYGHRVRSAPAHGGWRQISQTADCGSEGVPRETGRNAGIKPLTVNCPWKGVLKLLKWSARWENFKRDFTQMSFEANVLIDQILTHPPLVFRWLLIKSFLFVWKTILCRNTNFLLRRCLYNVLILGAWATRAPPFSFLCTQFSAEHLLWCAAIKGENTAFSHGTHLGGKDPEIIAEFWNWDTSGVC